MLFNEFAGPLVEDTAFQPSPYMVKLRTFWQQWQKARRDCSQIIKVLRAPSTKTFIYRGFRTPQAPIFKGQSVERMPEEGERREEVDAWFTQHGFAAQRHNSLFVANTPDQAAGYARDANERAGSLMIVLPCNGFQYTWYRDSHDLYQDNFAHTLDKLADHSIDAMMKRIQPTNTDIEQWLGTHRHHEMHFVGKFWAFDMHEYGQMVFDEISGQGVGSLKRRGVDPAILAYITG